MKKNCLFEEKIEDKVLFHYTTLETFFNIIKNGEFRLCDVTKSNDPLEGRFTINALEKAYKDLYSDETIGREQYHVAHAAFFQFNCNNDSTGKRTRDLYAAASFCQTKHEMTMLRCYANNGKGIAIGFSAKSLMNFADENPEMEFRKVQYITDEEMIKKAKAFWLSIFDLFHHYLPNISDDEAMKPIIQEIEKFVHEGFFIKHIANKDEEEYRLLYKASDLFGLSIFPKSVENQIDFFCNNDDIKAYYKIPVKEFISHVLIGPASNITPTELKVFLNKYEVYPYSVEKITWVNMR